MAIHDKEWSYFDFETRQWSPPLTLSELDALKVEGKIDETTTVRNRRMAPYRGPTQQGIPFSALSRISVDFDPDVEAFHAARAGHPITILSGPNNSGKTLLLKQIFSLVGHDGYLIACNRFSHVDTLSSRKQEKEEHFRFFDNFIQVLYTQPMNTENSDMNLDQVITGLKNTDRENLFALCTDLLGNHLSLQPVDPDNVFSSYYVDMDGQNLKFGSTGTRLLVTLLGIMMDQRFSVLLIDEPELGLSPRIQSVLARFLFDDRRRTQMMPHLRQLYVATHSHIFLDRSVLSNNQMVTKTGSTVSIRPVESVGEFNQLQFNMLGNEMEALFLPSAIVVVEGESDSTFLRKVATLHLPNHRVAIVDAHGDGGVKDKVWTLIQAFGDLRSSPYRERLFVVIDKTHSMDRRRIEDQGVRSDNIWVLSKNGIEYHYPPEIVAAIFRCRVDELQECNFESDPIEFKGMRKTKKELARAVVESLSAEHPLSEEIKGILNRIRGVCELKQ